MPRSLLLVSPDYASHFYPLSALGQACRRRGMSVTIATGPGLEPLVRQLGFRYEHLVLGPGNNPGLLRVEAQRAREIDHMQAFFDATATGPIAALTYQTNARRHDMLHDPAGVFTRLQSIIATTRPDLIVTDQLSYSATLALHALDVPFASFHPGNPHGIPARGHPFGLPRRFSQCLGVVPAQCENLRALCMETEQRFTVAFNTALASLAPRAAPVANAFHFTSEHLLFLNYPERLAQPYRDDVPGVARFLGSSLRLEPNDAQFSAALTRLRADLPTVYVSLGTFLSAREDVINQIVGALRKLAVNVILASGVADRTAWGTLPDNWVAQPVVPQLAALRRADLAISHGGNNTVTEAVTFGVPLLIGPMSSDQFDNAADVEDAGVGRVFAPNDVSVNVLAKQIEESLADTDRREAVHALSMALNDRSGPNRAADYLEQIEARPVSA